MNEVIKISLQRFLLIYLLLLIVLFIMKKCKIEQSKLLLFGSIQMTIQLIIAGYLLTYIFKNPKPIYTICYIIVMMAFAVFRVLSKNKNLNKKFKLYVALSLILSGLFVISFFIFAIVDESIFNPQYAIPLSGMIFGNVMTGLNLGIKTFQERLDSEIVVWKYY